MSIIQLKNNIVPASFLICSIFLLGCKKLVDVPNPENSITTEETFVSIPSATSVITGIYNSLSFGSNAFRYASGLTTIATGLSADELIEFGGPENAFWTNNLLRDNGDVLNGFWSPAYSDIYKANAAIEGLNASLTLPAASKNQLIGEAKFLRAFIYFYLVNIFGDIPLVTTTSFSGNSLLSRTPAEKIYQQIIVDLEEAATLLPEDYSSYTDQRTRATSWAAIALLARVYLYREEWSKAETLSTQIIDNSNYSLVNDLNTVFLKNSNEAILQWQCINQSNFQFATQEGNLFVPATDATPRYLVTNELLSSFEIEDLRRRAWIDSTIIESNTYYYPFKFKVRESAAGEVSES